MTIRHCVFLKFRADVSASEKQSIYGQLAALGVHLEIDRMSYGPNVSPEGLHQGFVDGFTMDFPNAAARDAYLVDSKHKEAGARLVAALEGGVKGLLVFDIEV
ncbi:MULTISPECIES: Dabb family protein [unclassified Devosia]|uniref:Dabb family protein n=1 Tax=unclassified Devosia TaxID=196773 RepID=UPI00086A0646|nr:MULTISPECIES: Dabb family protein [unclassified Devosia]MBN9365319.1 Dabb family protein [Devosia sp.]ODS85012.1 MAG: stress responsive protein [Devosia sp. SCN 66-27]OJX21614.1 MAG: stress responsive protein [Devosia sp. 66-14]